MSMHDFYLTQNNLSFLDKEIEQLHNSHLNNSDLFSLSIWKEIPICIADELIDNVAQLIPADSSLIDICLKPFFDSLSIELLKDEILSDIYYQQYIPYIPTNHYVNITSHIINQRISEDTINCQSEDDIKRTVKEQMKRFYLFLKDTNLLPIGIDYGLFLFDDDSAYNLYVHKDIIPLFLLAFSTHQNPKTEKSKLNILFSHLNQITQSNNNVEIPINYYMERFWAISEIYDCSNKAEDICLKFSKKLFPLMKFFHPCIAFPYISERKSSIKNFFSTLEDLIDKINIEKHNIPHTESITLSDNSNIFEINKTIFSLVANKWLFSLITNYYNKHILSSYLYLFRKLPCSGKEKNSALKQYLSTSKTTTTFFSFPKSVNDIKNATFKTSNKMISNFLAPDNNTDIYNNYLKFLSYSPTSLKYPCINTKFILGMTSYSAIYTQKQITVCNEKQLEYDLNNANFFLSTISEDIALFYEKFKISLPTPTIRDTSNTQIHVTTSYNQDN